MHRIAGWIICAAMLLPAGHTEAAVEGEVVGTQCWVGGVLQGGFPADFDCGTVSGGSAPQIIVGPPVIIWRHPSAEGSRMPGLVPIDDRLNNQLNAIADTAITLRQKGEFAMNHGDYAAAERYFEAARQRDPQDPTLMQDMSKLQGLFDSNTWQVAVPHYRVQEEVLAPFPASDLAKFKGNTVVTQLRNEELKAYRKLDRASQALTQIRQNAGQGQASSQDLSQAQAQMDRAANAFKQAHEALRKKIYVLEQDQK